jgi:hypothetical protein
LQQQQHGRHQCFGTPPVSPTRLSSSSSPGTNNDTETRTYRVVQAAAMREKKEKSEGGRNRNHRRVSFNVQVQTLHYFSVP